MANTKKKRENQGISRRDFIKGTAAVGVAAAVGSIGFPNVLRGAAPPEIPIGNILPLSGFLAFDGQRLRKGAMLAVKEINDAGGIQSLGGAKLKLLDADSEGKADRAISEVERLNRAGAAVITGCYQSSVTLVATQMAEKFRVPFVVSVAVADKITGRGFKYTFRHQPDAEQMASKSVRYISEIAKAAGETVKTVAQLHDNTAFGTSLAAHVLEYASQYGMEVILQVPYSPRAADVSTEVGKIKAAGADLVLTTGYFGDGVRVFRTIRDLRVKAKGIIGIGNGAYSHPKFVEELGSVTEYIMDGNLEVNPLSPLAKKALAHYKAEYGIDMSNTTAMCYQAIYIIADALERAESTDHDSIRKALTKTHITQHILPQGPIVFGPNGQNKNAAPAITQILGGKIKVVWPRQYALAEPVFPAVDSWWYS